MVRLRHPASAQALCDQGLFRASSAQQILSGLGKVFAEGLTGVIGAAEVSTLRPEDVSSAGDAAFAGTEPVSHVEVFISHTWGSPRWLKYLGICYFLNMGLAVKAAVTAWLLAVVGLMVFKVTKMFCGKQYLLLLLTEFPVLVFFVFFFFGQSLSRGLWAPTFWLDKLCIHQTNQNLKAQQVAALPVFVARSTRMLVLWDDTYFERLWCNMEMATFAQYSESPEKMEFVPLWLAPWLLSAVLLDLLGVEFLRFMEADQGTEMVTQTGIRMGSAMLGDSKEALLFLEGFLHNFPYFVCYLPMALPTMLSFKNKIQGHQLMLRQMASFDVKKAKCSVESDRPLVEEQVAMHFRPKLDTDVIVAGGSEPAPEAVESGALQEEALDRFNSYVQGPLRSTLLDCIGDVHDVPFQLCSLCMLPMTTFNATAVIPSAWEGCGTLTNLGYANPWDWRLWMPSLVAWCLAQTLAYPVTFPLLLRLLQQVESATENAWMRLFFGILCSCFVYAYTFFVSGMIFGCAMVLSQRSSFFWIAASLFAFAFLVIQFWLLFGPRRTRGCGSCRCVEYRGGEDSKPILGLHRYDGD
ncbi:unnamed protein product [Symbiodinium sp. CCMP2592]|nr:unnamed protein product [Symbiodinium sp. CCMP2592]